MMRHAPRSICHLSRLLVPLSTLTILTSLAALAALGGCSTEPEATASGASDGDVPSWEEFRAAAARTYEGREVYVVEGDQALTLEELRAYYEGATTANQSRGLGTIEQPSIVNRVGGLDDIWSPTQARNLTYCVSNEFGANKARAIDEMNAATGAWEALANVDFKYLPAHDAACNNANPAVVFSVRPHTGGGACAFFPSGGGCVPRTLIMNFLDLDTNYGTISPNVRTVGVFRHELGHILGLRHEHTRPESGVCFEDSSWRALTPYDRSSVMHYPWCNGITASDLSITPSDAAGIRQLYGTSTCSGQTTPGATAWQQYTAQGLFLSVNTSGCGFTATPRYFSSIGGFSGHWMSTGASAIYAPTPTGFIVYLYDLAGPVTPAVANSRGWHINWQASADNVRRSDLCTGATPSGSTAWQAYGTQTVWTDVNTSACGFTATPRYVTSIGGTGVHWMSTGATSIYFPTATGFRIFVYDPTGPVTPATANARGWNINWQATPDAQRPPSTCSGGTSPTATVWQVWDARSIYTDVNTAACGFTATPRYVPSLGGNYGHWLTAGVTSVYSATPTGFRVYVYGMDGPITPAYATSNGWHVNWEAR